MVGSLVTAFAQSNVQFHDESGAYQPMHRML
jgi:acyl dehydratase